MARRRDADVFNISFLDVMCCGFGAIILLLMITKNSAPVPLEVSEQPREGSVLELQRQLFAIRGETATYNRELNARHEQLSEYEERIARLRRELSDIQGRSQATTERSSVGSILEGRLALARQELTDEMRRLQSQQAELQQTEAVAGVPV